MRGSNTVKRSDQSSDSALATGVWEMIDTAADVGGTGNDSGTGSFIVHTANATVSGTFSYLADATLCELLATMDLMQ